MLTISDSVSDLLLLLLSWTDFADFDDRGIGLGEILVDVRQTRSRRTYLGLGGLVPLDRHGEAGDGVQVEVYVSCECKADVACRFGRGESHDSRIWPCIYGNS